MNFKKVFYSIAAFFSVSGILIFASCEVGLGASVDTESPTVSITYPPASSVIMESFVLAGKCEDDKGVKNVTVTINGSDDATKKCAKNYTVPQVTVNSDGTWTVTINVKDPSESAYPLCDGKYTFNAVAKDNSGRKSGESSRTLEIDNTAPFFMVSNPGTTDILNPSKYGSSLKVTGEIAEDHSVSSMKLTVYDTDGNSKAEWIQRDINTSGGTNVIFASYSDNAESGDELNENYKAIYDLSTAGTQKFYGMLTVSDSAGIWRTPDYTDNSDLNSDLYTTSGIEIYGNSTSTIWLYDSIYGSSETTVSESGKSISNNLLSAKADPKYELGDLMAVLNGTSSKSTKEDALLVLNSTALDTSVSGKNLAFSMNKDANPEYEILGESVDGETFTDVSSSSKDSSFTLKASAGLNGTNINPATFNIYIIGPVSASGVTSDDLKVIYNANKVEEWLSDSDNSKYIIHAYDGKNGIEGESDTAKFGPYSGSSVSTTTLTFYIPSAAKSRMKGKERYVICATGEDADGVSLAPSVSGTDVYGFEVQVAGKQPSVSFTSPSSDGLVKSASEMIFRGTAKDPDQETPVTGVTVTVTVTDSLNDGAALGTITGNASAETGTFGTDKTVSWKFDVTSSSNTWKASSGVTADPRKNTSGVIWKYSAVAEASSDYGTGMDSRSCTMDSKAPVPSISSIDKVSDSKDVTSSESTYTEKTVNGTIKISGAVSEQNLESSTLTVNGTAYSLGTNTYFEKIIDTTGFTDDAVFEIVLSSKDKAGNTDSVSYDTTTQVRYKTDQDTDKPVVTVTNMTGTSVTENVFGNGNNKININAEDDDGLDTVYWTIKKSGTKIYSGSQKENGSTTAVVSIDLSTISSGSKLSDGEYTLEVYAADLASSKYSDSSVTPAAVTGDKVTKPFAFDDDVPSIQVTKFNGSTYADGSWAGSSAEVWLKVSDSTSSDGSALTVTADSKQEKGTDAKYASADLDDAEKSGTWDSTNKVWKFTVKNTDGEYKNTYKVSDKYGRSAQVTISYKVDTTAPVVNGKLITVSGAHGTEKPVYYLADDGNTSHTVLASQYFSSGTLTISGLNGVITEANPKAPVITVTKPDGTTAVLNPNVDSSKGNAFEVTSNFTDGISTFTISESDEAGNTDSTFAAKSFSVYVDSTAPSVTAASSDIFTDSVTVTKSNSVTVKVSASDTGSSGLSAILIGTTQNFGTAVCTVPVSDSPASVSNKSIDVDISGLSDGTYELWARAVDSAGNKSESDFQIKDSTSSYSTFTVDRTSPSVSYTSPGQTQSDAQDKKVKISGTVNDSNFVSDGSKPVLYYWNSDTNAMTACTSTWVSSDIRTENNWSIVLDTTKLLPDATGGASDFIYYQVLITDKAGNVNTLYKNGDSIDLRQKLYVNQNLDRPVIKFNELSAASGSTRMYSADISGTIIDSDADYASCELKISTTGKTLSQWQSYTNEGTVTLESSGFFKYIPSDTSDGNHNLYFYFKDSEGGEFYTGAASKLNQPYQLFSTGTQSDNSGVISYKSDKTPPDINYILMGTGSTAAEAQADLAKQFAAGTSGHNGKNNDYNMKSSVLAGGTSAKYVAFGVDAWDVNGIASITVTDPSDNTKTITLSETTYSYTDDDSVSQSVTGMFTAAKSVAALSTTSVYSETITVAVKDSSGLSTDTQKTVVVTNIGPEITVSSPNASELLSAGNVINFTGTATATGSGTTSEIWYHIVNNDDYTHFGVTAGTKLTDSSSVTSEKVLSYLKTLDYSNETNSTRITGQFNFKFNSSDANVNAAQKLPDEDTISSISSVPHTDSGLYNLPVWIYAVDALGNASWYEHVQKYNPYGDRPTVKILYPEADSTSNVAKISGSIRVNGSATDNESIDSVYLQIDVNKDGKFNTTDINYLKDYYDIYTCSGSSYASISGVTVLTEGTYTADTDFWGIKMEGSASWYGTINSKKHLTNSSTELQQDQNKLTDGTYQVMVRAYALDNNKKLGLPSDTLTLVLDPNAPKIGTSVSPYVQFYDDAGNATGSLPYTADMWLKGKCSLVVSVEDEGNISDVKYYLAASQSAISSASPEAFASSWAGSSTSYTNGNKGYTVTIPLGTESGAGTKAVKIHAEDNSSPANPSESIFTFKYDNTAPTLSNLLAGSESFEDGISLKNTNSYLTIQGDASDANSGFYRTMFYFYRDDKASTSTSIKSRRVYDPFIKANPTASDTAVRTDVIDSSGKAVTGITSMTITDGTDSTKSVPVYGKTLTVTRNAETTLTLSAKDSHIRNGGLVYINDTWLKLMGSSDGLTFTLTKGDETQGVSVATSITSAFFPYAQVVDNTKTEEVSSYAGYPFTFTSGDDGDGMPEVVTSVSTLTTWKASLFMNCIPDGPVTFVMAVFDQSGNVSVDSVTAYVENNAPRLAKLGLATDLSGDGSYQDTEFETYDLLGIEGEYKSAFSLTTAGYAETKGVTSTRGAFTAKDKLALVPEFTGGNGEIKMVLKRGSDGISKITAANGNATISSAMTKLASANTTYVRTASNTYLYELTNTQLTGKTTPTNDDDGTKKMSFTFWDSTDETKCGTDSQSSVLQIEDLKLDLTDGEDPTAVITPLYWRSNVNNSTGKTITYDTDGETLKSVTFNGHIDLKGTWNSNGNDAVSGKIIIEGTAHDNRRLSALKMYIDDYAMGASASGTRTTTANTAVQTAATCTNGIWTSNISGFTVTSSTLDQTGHDVAWKYEFDSEMIKSIAKSGVKIHVTAADSSSNSGSASDYAVDVVPYITKVSTGLDGAYKKIPSAFNRSAQGWYPMRRGETGIKLYGYNLNGASTTVKFNGTSVGTITAGSTSDYVTFTVPSTATSGEITVEVSSVASKNNLNDNTQVNNQEDNNLNNSTLTDDRKVRVWGTTEVVTDSSIRYPTFRVGTGSGNPVVFAYDVGGTDFYTYKNGTKYYTGSSYTQWYDTAVAVDGSGNLYAAALNGDCASPGSTSTNYCASFYWYPAITSSKEVWAYTSSGQTYYNFSNSGAYAVENTANGTRYNPSRVQNPKLVNVYDSTNKQEKVYMSYYDSTDGVIKFRAGTYKKGSVSSALGNYSTGTNGSAPDYQTIASGSSASAYSCVGVLSDGTAVVAYYDASDKALKIKYNTNPISGTTWSDEIIVDDDFAGWYPDMAVDGDDGIHIAYYSNASGSGLRYAYIEDVTDTDTTAPVTCNVDSYLSVGTNISIAVSSTKTSVAVSSTKTVQKYVPYISYYMGAFTSTSTCVKTAWPCIDKSAGDYKDGVEDDVFNGNWEVMILPLDSLPLNYTVGIGMKSNGTSMSPILGYGTSTGLETAVLY